MVLHKSSRINSYESCRSSEYSIQLVQFLGPRCALNAKTFSWHSGLSDTDFFRSCPIFVGSSPSRVNFAIDGTNYTEFSSFLTKTYRRYCGKPQKYTNSNATLSMFWLQLGLLYFVSLPNIFALLSRVSCILLTLQTNLLRQAIMLTIDKSQ